MKSRLFLIATLLSLTICGRSQQFKADSLRVLPNDISASMEPVYDLNNDICALVKVVCSHDFAFSSPLGIAKRRNETGEVWLYLPEGSMLLTIKHPQWGVLRDYKFPYPLKSQTTYELHISEPWQQDHIPIGNWSTTTPTNPRRDTLVIISQQTKIRHPRQPLHICLSAGVSIGSASLMPGIRIAAIKRHGLYLSAYSSLRSTPATQGTTAEAITYNTGRTRNSCTLLTAGFIHQLGKSFLLYEGGGWGNHQEVWEQIDGQWYSHEEKCHKGWSVEAGLGYCYRNQWFASIGLQTITTKEYQAAISIGLFLSTKKRKP